MTVRKKSPLYDAQDLQCVAGGSEGRAHQGRRTAVRRPDLRDIRGLRLLRDRALSASLSDAFT